MCQSSFFPSRGILNLVHQLPPFTTERGTPFTTDAIDRLVKTIGQRAGLSLPLHFHMLRHSCGYKLANRLEKRSLT